MGVFKQPQDMSSWEARGAMNMPALWTPPAPKVSPTGMMVGGFSDYSSADKLKLNSQYGKTDKGLYVPPKLWAEPTKAVDDLAVICPGIRASKECPVEDCSYHHKQTALTSVIIHLNDTHKWSREKVADWLDVISTDNPDLDLTIIGGKSDATRTSKAAA